MGPKSSKKDFSPLKHQQVKIVLRGHCNDALFNEALKLIRTAERRVQPLVRTYFFSNNHPGNKGGTLEDAALINNDSEYFFNAVTCEGVPSRDNGFVSLGSKTLCRRINGGTEEVRKYLENTLLIDVAKRQLYIAREKELDFISNENSLQKSFFYNFFCKKEEFELELLEKVVRTTFDELIGSLDYITLSTYYYEALRTASYTISIKNPNSPHCEQAERIFVDPCLLSIANEDLRNCESCNSDEVILTHVPYDIKSVLEIKNKCRIHFADMDRSFADIKRDTNERAPYTKGYSSLLFERRTVCKKAITSNVNLELTFVPSPGFSISCNHIEAALTTTVLNSIITFPFIVFLSPTIGMDGVCNTALAAAELSFLTNPNHEFMSSKYNSADLAVDYCNISQRYVTKAVRMAHRSMWDTYHRYIFPKFDFEDTERTDPGVFYHEGVVLLASRGNYNCVCNTQLDAWWGCTGADIRRFGHVKPLWDAVVGVENIKRNKTESRFGDAKVGVKRNFPTINEPQDGLPVKGVFEQCEDALQTFFLPKYFSTVQREPVPAVTAVIRRKNLRAISASNAERHVFSIDPLINLNNSSAGASLATLEALVRDSVTSFEPQTLWIDFRLNNEHLDNPSPTVVEDITDEVSVPFRAPAGISIPMDFPPNRLGCRRAELWISCLVGEGDRVNIIVPSQGTREELLMRLYSVGIEPGDGRIRLFTAEKNTASTRSEADVDEHMLRLCSVQDLGRVLGAPHGCLAAASVGPLGLFSAEEMAVEGMIGDTEDIESASPLIMSTPSPAGLVSGCPSAPDQEALVIDVRTSAEFSNGSHRRSILYPLQRFIAHWRADRSGAHVFKTLKRMMAELIDKTGEETNFKGKILVLYCAAGYRSHIAATLLRHATGCVGEGWTVYDVGLGAYQLMLQRPDLWQVKDRSIICVS